MNAVLLVISCVFLLILGLGFMVVADVTSKIVYSHVLRYRTRGFYSALVQPCVWVATIAVLVSITHPILLGIMTLLL